MRCFLQILRQQNLLGQQAPGPVKLGQERRQDLLRRLSPGGEDLQVPPGQLAPLEVEDSHAAADLAGVQAQNVGVRQKTRHDLLPLAQQRNGFQPVPQGGGPLELQGLGGFLHLLPQVFFHLAELALQKADGLGHGLLVLAARHLLAAVAVTKAHVEVEAGPLLPLVPWEFLPAGGQLQGPADGV